jgi:alkylation response protein AidB-like acyl-CoA dehydrogenase
MNLCLTDEQTLLRRSLRELAEAELAPHRLEWDEGLGFPRELLT